MTDERIQSLTIYLARPGTIPEDLIDDDRRPTAMHYNITIDHETAAELYIAPPNPGPPDWASFFDGYISLNQIGENSSTAAVLLVEVRSKYFALTFGRGRFLLNSECLEEKFGLKVALNCIGEGTVRSIQKHSLDQILRHSQEQASRDATPLEFGFDIEQDLLGGVTGRPTDPYFGGRISGAESLHLAVPIHMNGVPELLNKLSDKFLDRSYQAKFPWVDHIAEVMSSRSQDELDETLIKELSANQRGSIWMAVPEPVQWVRISRFRFSALGQSLDYADIHLDNFLSALHDTPLTIDLLKKKQVIAIDENGEPLHKWSAYKCLYAELDHRGDSFLLSGGKWYAVKSDFVKDVNSDYDLIPQYDEQFPEFKHPTEAAYLAEVAQLDPAKYALMDQKFIHSPGKMEFCDLFTARKDICHIKRYGQAGVLSHLFAQGLISGEMFRSDPKFRKLVNEKLPDAYKIRNSDERPHQDEYRIVFGIVSDRAGELRLPFFSRLNFKHAVRRLEAYGYRVAKAKIAVNEVFSKTGKKRLRRSKG